jgi:hypothetical protein
MKIRHRMPAIIGGYVAASAAAGFALSVVGLLASPVGARYSVGGVLFLAAFGGTFFAMAIAVGALVPAAAVIWYAETRTLTSVWFYLGIGSLAGALAYGVYAILTVLAAGTVEAFFEVDPASLRGALVLLFGAPGLAGGFVYWLVAGRTAGDLPRIRPPRGDLA